MTTMSITKDIRSITDLKRNTSDLLNQMHMTKRAIVLTVNGKAEAVLLDALEYEKTMDAMNTLRALIPAEEDIRAGRTHDARTFFKEFKRAKKI